MHGNDLIEFIAQKAELGPDDVDRIRNETARTGANVEQTVVDLGMATAETVYRALAEFAGVDYVSLKKIEIEPEIIERIPARFVTHYEFMPVAEDDGRLVVAVTQPLDTHLMDELRLMLRCRIQPVVSTPAEIAAATKRYYGIGADTVEQMISEAVATGTIDLDSPTSEVLDDTMVDASIVKFVNELLYEAISSDATDIHIEPFENELRVRNRIDGILHQASVPPNIKEFHHSIVSRIKILANLNIAEHRLPQDGKIEATLGGENYDLRVSILPTPHGETVNIRILSRQSMFLSLNDLGLAGDQYNLFETLITRPHGVILVTGPTGSGKTTTLYAALQKINNAERKIITIEDPIEYQLSGITQMQVLEKIGFTFARGLRSMLRHDPDIMMVGEIRDFETAEVAIRCSLTGHLVFSTLHTNDAASSITRLVDMGVEPFLVASSLVAILAQRLVRRVCPTCREPYEPTDADLNKIGIQRANLEKGVIYRSRGCKECLNTGYKGREGIYELMSIDDDIRQMILEKTSSAALKKAAKARGMLSLREDGARKVAEGLTTIAEVMRVTQDDVI